MKYFESGIAVAIIVFAGSTAALSQGEQRQRPQAPAFSDVDTSADGVLSREEFDAWVTANRERRAQRGDGEGRMAPRGGAGGRGGADVFSRIDSDGDGSVTEAEFTAMLDEMRARRGQGRPSGPDSQPAKDSAT